MFSVYLANQQQKKQQSLLNSNASLSDVAVARHRSLTARLAQGHYERVDEWMSDTERRKVPILPQKPLTIPLLQTHPNLFFRPSNSQTSDASPRFSARRYETEQERLKRYEQQKTFDAAEAYRDPLKYDLRVREKQKELHAPFVFNPQCDSARINAAAADQECLSARAGPYQPPEQMRFRSSDPSKWRGGHFTARLPAMPLFSATFSSTMHEPYVAPSHPRLRASTPSVNSSTPRFSSVVPLDRVIPLPPSSPRAPHPPAQQINGKYLLTVTGGSQLYDNKQLHQKTYWKDTVQLAHTTMSGEMGQDKAIALFHTYRKHLNY